MLMLAIVTLLNVISLESRCFLLIEKLILANERHFKMRHFHFKGKVYSAGQLMYNLPDNPAQKEVIFSFHTGWSARPRR